MDVVLLGTGNPTPNPQRAGAATLVRTSAGAFLVDCGRAVTMRLAAAGIATPASLKAVLITHRHSDHTIGFSDVIASHWLSAPQGESLQIYGPEGTASFVERTLAALADDTSYRLAHDDQLTWEPAVKTTEVGNGDELVVDGVRIVVATVDHGTARPAVGYRFEDGDAVVAIAGDTTPTPGLDRLVKGAHIYVQTVLRRPLIEQKPALHPILTLHSSTEDAGRTAAKGEVRTLVFTHILPPPAPGTEREWIDDARQHFDGEVLMGQDLLEVTA